MLKAVEHGANYIKPQDVTNTLMNILSVMKLLWVMHFLDMFCIRRGKQNCAKLKIKLK